METMEMSRLPVPTWNWLGMNESVLKGEDAKDLKNAKREEPETIALAPGETRECIFHFACADGENQVRELELLAEDESRLTVWTDISSSRAARGLFSLHTRIKAGKNARVRLVQVQLLGQEYRFVDEIKTECEAGAEVELLQLFLGGAKTWAGFRGDLQEAKSRLSADVGYWCRGTQRLDMNYVVLHKGKSTQSRLFTKGVLEDEAFKLFRGTIDFKNGAAGSEGEETEEVLMLGDGAVNQTIPLILCEEEDVLGNHGATIGEPDEEVLFYMAARGIGKDAATAILARAKIDGLRAQIGNPALEESVKNYLEEEREHA